LLPFKGGCSAQCPAGRLVPLAGGAVEAAFVRLAHHPMIESGIFLTVMFMEPFWNHFRSLRNRNPDRPILQ
jgi:hypothetical protein